MRSIHRTVRSALVVVAALALVLTGAGSATASTWTLRDVGQRMCVTSDFGHPGAYFFAPVVGSWSSTIRTGITDLPPGSTSPGGNSLPPGSNDTDNVNGFVPVSIAPAPVAVYHAEVWASDGRETQTAPVTIRVQERC